MTGAGAGRGRSPAAPPPVFLERQSYRRRRLIDAARLLPILGGVLFAIPLLWPRGQGGGADPVPTSSASLYIFAVWAGLIVLSGLFGYLVRGQERSDVASGDERDDGGSGGAGEPGGV